MTTTGAVGQWAHALEPDSLHAEFNVRTPEDPAEFGRLAVWWMQTALDELGRDAAQRLSDGPPLPTGSLSRHQGAFGKPGTPWGSVILQPEERRRQGSLYAWSPKAWDRMLQGLDRYPREARLSISTLGEFGTPGDGDNFEVTVTRDYPGHQGWTRLVAFRAPRPPDDHEWNALAHRWAGFVRDQAQSPMFTPAFGFLADDTNNDFRTPFEVSMGLTAEEILGGDLARGYSWVTVINAGAANRVGGVDGLRASGAFAQVTPLPDGGLVLRATHELTDYTEPAYRRVFQSLAPALMPGLPRRSEFGRDRRLVFQDSTDVLPRSHTGQDGPEPGAD